MLLVTFLTMSASGNVVGTVKRKNLTTSEKRAAIAELLKGSKNGKLGKGDSRGLENSSSSILRQSAASGRITTSRKILAKWILIWTTSVSRNLVAKVSIWCLFKQL